MCLTVVSIPLMIALVLFNTRIRDAGLVSPWVLRKPSADRREALGRGPRVGLSPRGGGAGDSPSNSQPRGRANTDARHSAQWESTLSSKESARTSPMYVPPLARASARAGSRKVREPPGEV